MIKHQFTREQLEFLREIAPGLYLAELTDQVNVKFGLHLEQSQIRACKKNHRITTGLDGRFIKGNVPYSKGKPATAGWISTQFKKDKLPHNYLPVGSERVNGDDYVDIKIADPNKWRAKHKILWEAAYGTIPADHVIIFGDRNRRNFDIDNLLLITRAQLCTMNKKGLIFDDTESTKSGALVAKILNTASNRLTGRRSWSEGT